MSAPRRSNPPALHNLNLPASSAMPVSPKNSTSERIGAPNVADWQPDHLTDVGGSRGEVPLAASEMSAMEPNSSPLSSAPSGLTLTSSRLCCELPQSSSQTSPSSQPSAACPNPTHLDSAIALSPKSTDASVMSMEVSCTTQHPERASKQKTTKIAQQKITKPNTKTKAKTSLLPPTAGNRPTRNRQAPKRFWEVSEDVAPKALSNNKGPSKIYDPTYITTNSTSRLVKAEVHRLLLEESAWTSLSAEQQKELLSMLPQRQDIQALVDKIDGGHTEDTRPLLFTLSNDCFRTDVAKFKTDLQNGHLAKTWRAAAEQAVVDRAAGEYDSWKTEEAERWWGQKSK